MIEVRTRKQDEMKYVARTSQDIENDINRGWSAWGGKSAYQSDRELLENSGVDTCDLTDEQCSDRAWSLVQRNPHWNMRYDEKYEMWARLHHEGLSCWYLSDTLDEAVAMASNPDTVLDMMIAQTTVGDVKVVAEVKRDDLKLDGHDVTLYILEVDDVMDEELVD